MAEFILQFFIFQKTKDMIRIDTDLPAVFHGIDSNVQMNGKLSPGSFRPISGIPHVSQKFSGLDFLPFLYVRIGVQMGVVILITTI